MKTNILQRYNKRGCIKVVLTGLFLIAVSVMLFTTISDTEFMTAEYSGGVLFCTTIFLSGSALIYTGYTSYKSNSLIILELYNGSPDSFSEVILVNAGMELSKRVGLGAITNKLSLRIKSGTENKFGMLIKPEDVDKIISSLHTALPTAKFYVNMGGVFFDSNEDSDSPLWTVGKMANELKFIAG